MTRHNLCLFSFSMFVVLLTTALAAAAEPAVTAELADSGDRVTVKIDGELFAEYLTRSGTKPIVWPIMGPTGKPLTRSWPMGELEPNERSDHPHQRSFWFTHGDVNGCDFWAEEAKDGHPLGTIQHRKFVKICSGDKAVIVTENDWLGPDGKRICQDQWTLAFGKIDANRFIDLDITLKATDGPVRLGDTKEGCWGIRMIAALQPEGKLGGKLVNSDGLKNNNAWGKRADWVDYTGVVGGQAVGLAMMNHPTSFGYPTPWHARGYGLCAANPFGLKDFDEKAAQDGTFTIPEGDSITFRYRLFLHLGDTQQGKVAEVFSDYAARAK